MSQSDAEAKRANLNAILHELSQPLTTLSLALTLAQTPSSQAERAFALDAAAHECQRAMVSVRHLRALLNEEQEALFQASSNTGHDQTGKWQAGRTA